MANVNEKKSYSAFELDNMNFDYSYDEAVSNLKNPDCEDFIKIFSIINMTAVKSMEDFKLLIYHLTDHANPIREAAALKIEELYSDKYFDEYVKNQFLKGVTDINPNVSRALCCAISKSRLLQNSLEEDITDKINLLISQIKNDDNKECKNIRKNHALNKKTFSLYWLLEVLSLCISNKNNTQVLEILKFSILFSDYTIREKAAKILSLIDNPPEELLNFAKSDQNFYVKNQVYDKMNFED